MSELHITLLAIAVPFALYGIVWLLGRAFYSGKLSAIRASFYKRKKR